MIKGEKLFFGTVFASTFLGLGVGYAVAEEQNSAPVESVVDQGIELRIADEELASTIASLPLCGNTVVVTLQNTEFLGSLAAQSINNIESQCNDGSESDEIINDLSLAFDNQQSAKIAYESAIDKNEFSFQEKFIGSSMGFLGGWLAGWAIALSGYSINSVITEQKSKRHRGSTITG